jgi:hypothetical protein
LISVRTRYSEKEPIAVPLLKYKKKDAKIMIKKTAKGNALVV